MKISPPLGIKVISGFTILSGVLTILVACFGTTFLAFLGVTYPLGATVGIVVGGLTILFGLGLWCGAAWAWYLSALVYAYNAITYLNSGFMVVFIIELAFLLYLYTVRKYFKVKF